MENNKNSEYYYAETSELLTKMRDKLNEVRDIPKQIRELSVKLTNTRKEAYENLTASDFDKFNKNYIEQTSKILSEIRQIID